MDAFDLNPSKLNLSLISRERLSDIAYLIGVSHDFGKATTWFQNYIHGRSNASVLTRHSLISAVVCYYAVMQEFNDGLYAYIAFQVTMRHHGDLSSFDMSMSFKQPDFEIASRQLQNILVNSCQFLDTFFSYHNILNYNKNSLNRLFL